MQCYRHPARETHVACSGCGRPICPDCMTPSPVGMRCPECAGERTRVVRAGGLTERTLLEAAPVTAVLIAINAIVFLGEFLTGGPQVLMSRIVTGSVLVNGVFFGPLVADGELWRIVTAGFLHFGILHLGMNMVLLFLLGRQLEEAIGRVRFAGIYFASLVAGSLGSLLVQPDAVSAGASGAVFGLMGATLVVARSRGINPWESGIGGLIVFNLLITFTIPGIAIGGHVGGVVAGVAIGWILSVLEGSRSPSVSGVLPAAVLGIVVTGALFVATALVAHGKFAELIG